MADAQTATDDNGQYSFTGLRAGTYSVEISGFDMDEVGFGSISSAATVGVGESKVISFDGTYLRTAGIMGQVAVEGVGLAGVTVTMTGEGEDMTDVTDAGGLYAFSKLKAGDYSVAISGYDTDDYEFATTSENVTVATGETANIPFEGILLRTAGISGRVSVEGTGIDGVEVVLAGAADATAMTSSGGQYSFAGLAEGTYVVSMTNPNADAYSFETMQYTIALADSESKIQNFEGTHTRTASVSGMLFIDEVMQDKMHTAGEPSITAALAPLVAHGLLDEMVLAGLLSNAKVLLRGPDLNTMTEVSINADGTYTTGEALQAGSYQVELPANNEMVAAGLAAAGVAFVGESAVVTVAAGGSETVNFPFRITMQTVGVGAVMGNAEMVSDPPLPVEGVTLALFPTAQDAEAGTNMLGMGAETGETGMTAFQFARADDTSPGSEDTDNIVFVKVVEAGHEDLMVSDGAVIEVRYPGVSRVHAAPTSVRFVNVAVNFQFWIKNDADARGGDVLVDGWHTDVYMGEVTDESVPLMMEDEDGDTVNLTMPSESAEDDDGMQGRVMVTYRVTADQLPATFSAALRPDNTDDTDDIDDWQQPMAMGETWEAVGDGLTYTHTGFALPKYNTHEVNDLNLNPRFGQAPLRVTFTTQKLTVGVYRETDDEPGFTNFQSKVDGGDQRPHKDIAAEMSVSVMVEASGRRGLEVYDEWDHDRNPKTPAIDATITGLTGGMATFGNLPADMDFTVQLNEGSDRVAVGGPDSRSDRVQAYGDDLDLGMSVGAFGDDSGAGPEVRLCPLSSSSEDDMCSTFGYQWTSGSADGKVTRRGAGVASATVNLDAITDNHSPDESTKTSKAAATKGNYSFSGVQDGEYWVRTPATKDNKADSARVALYHDEEEDDDEDDGITGNPATYTKDFDVTALRLEIKGYVANDGQEGDNETPDLDQIVRGDEAVAGIELELLTITKVSTNKKDTTFKVHQTTETEDDGSYAFSDVVEGSAYYVRATGTGEYHAAEASAMDGFSRKVPADEYPAVEEGEFALPYWNYNEGKAMMTAVTVSDEDGEVEASFVNFALLYVDGSISGRVREASGNPGNITIELIRCDTYDADDAECGTYNRDDFPTLTTETAKNGSWEFNDLLEGWYEVYVGEAGYLAANIDDKKQIDDDGATESADMHTGLVKGRRDLAAGNNFYLYDNGLADDDDLDGIEVEGTTDPDDDPEDLAANATIAAQGSNAATAITGVSSTPITFGSESVTVEPDIHEDATFKVTTGAGKTLKSWPISKGVATVDLGWNKTGSEDEGEDPMETEITVAVTAENGYDDHDYTFSASRMNPVGNELLARDFVVEAPVGADVVAAFGQIDQFTVNVAEKAEELTFTVELEDIEKQVLMVSMGGDEVKPSDRKRADRSDEQRYEVELADGANTIDLMVTSEDEEEQSYQLIVRRDARSGDATLKALSLSAGSLSPAFNAATTSYTASVANAVTSVRVTATANHSGATISQSPTNPVALAVGPNRIAVTVTAEDGTTETYTVTVSRDSPGVSSDATLSALSLSEGALSPAFDPAMLEYTASVANSVTGVTVTATANHGSASVAQDPVNPVELMVGVAKEITVTVTAEDATTMREYTVTVTREAPGISSDADLGALSLSAGTLDPEFDAATTSYTASVGNAVTSVRVTATASHSGASVSQSPTNPVPLNVGDTEITVTVTAGDGTTMKEYTVTVTRGAAGASTDATLSALSLSGVTLNEEFAATTYAYTADVANSVESTTVAATAMDAAATVTLPDPNPVVLDEGDTEITVTVTAEDGTTTQAYTVTVTRAAAPTVPGLLVSIEDVTVMEGTERDYTMRLTTRPSGDVSVALTVEAHADNPANADVTHITTTRTSLTFNENNWNRARTVTIAVAEDENESSEIANINHAISGTGSYNGLDPVAIKVTAGDNDVVSGAAIRVDMAAVTLTEDDEDDGSAEVMVRLAAMPTGEVTVTVATSAEAVATVAPPSLTFTASNWDDEQAVTVTSVADDDPADAEATVTLSATGGGYGSAEDVEVAIAVEDDEEATISVSDDFENAEIVEGGNLTYVISLSAPPVAGETVRVNLQARGLATVDPAQAVFTSDTQDNQITITVATLADSDSDDETLLIIHTVDADEDSGYRGAAPPSNINVAVKDSDAAGVVVSRTSLSVEEGQTVTYSVRLTKAPSTDESVTIHLAGTGVNLSTGSLTFTSGDFSTPQPVTVTGHTDSDSVDDQAMVEHTVVATGGDEDYDGVTASTVRITVTEPPSS